MAGQQAPPSCLRLPLIISESLRSPVSAANGSSTHGIISSLLSGADLVKLDLVKLQFFAIGDFAIETAAPMASAKGTVEVKAFSGDDFTFHTPFILSPMADLSPESLPFPVFKSKGVVEAEKVSAEHHSLKFGAVSSSPRARRKAVSVDEISRNGTLSSVESVAAENVPGTSNCKKEQTRDRVKARRRLPELELMQLPQPDSEQWLPLPHPVLEQRADTLQKKHFECMLSRKVSAMRSEGAKIDLQATPAAKFLLQVMSWELTPPVTPSRTPAGIPFIWEDVPGRPKPCALPSPCQSLPLPPRLVPVPAPSSSSAVSCALASSSSDSTEFADGGRVSSAAVSWKPANGGRHRKNMHSWHVLQGLFSGSNQQCPLQSADTVVDKNKGANSSLVLRPENVLSARDETSTSDSASSSSSCANSNTSSSDLSPSIATASEDPSSSFETSLSARYELPPLYVAPMTTLTPPYKDLGPLDDDCSKQSNRLAYLAGIFRKKRGKCKEVVRAGSFFYHFKKHDKIASYGSSHLLSGAKGEHVSSKASNCTHEEVETCHIHSELVSYVEKSQTATPLLSPPASCLHKSLNMGRQRICLASRSKKFFIKTRRRGARVVVASYKAMKRALFLKGARDSRLSHLSQLRYHMLQIKVSGGPQ